MAKAASPAARRTFDLVWSDMQQRGLPLPPIGSDGYAGVVEFWEQRGRPLSESLIAEFIVAAAQQQTA